VAQACCEAWLQTPMGEYKPRICRQEARLMPRPAAGTVQRGKSPAACRRARRRSGTIDVGALTDRGYLFEGIKAFAGPRRLTLAIAGLPQAKRRARGLKGPRPTHPRRAGGFLKKTNLQNQFKLEKTSKGDV